MMRLRCALLAALLVGVGIGPAAAQETGLVLRLPGSTRALALGDVFPLGTADADAVFYDPAFAEGLRGISAAVQPYGSASTLMTASGAMDWWGGAVAIGLRSLDYRFAGGPLSTPQPATLFSRTGTPISERAVSAGYARGFGGLGLAASAKWVESRIGGERGATAAFDAAAGVSPGPFRVGLAVQDLGPDLEAGGRSYHLPTRATLSATLRGSAPLGPLDVLPVAAVTWERVGRWTPAAGVEVAYWPVIGRTFYARAGVRRAPEGERPFTLGAGFSGDRISLDYAYEPFDGGRGAHRFGVRWHTGR